LASKNKGAPLIPPTREEHEKTLYDELVLLDKNLESCINNIVYILEADTSVLPADPLKDHETWLRSTQQTLRAIKSGDDLATKTLLAAMLERVEDHITKIEADTRIPAGEALARHAEKFDTGVDQCQSSLRIILPAHLHQ
jgi:hypothetical protein